MEKRGPAVSPEELFEHADFLRALARALLGDEQRAEDVVQDAWAIALERPPRRAASLRAFLATVVRRLASNAGRGEGRRRAREELAARPEREPDGAEQVERLQLQRAVLDEVLALREPYRSTIYLRYYEGLAPTEIAARTGAPVKTVKSRLSRALDELRSRLDARSRGDRAAWLAALVPVAFPRAGSGAAAGTGAAGGLLGGVLVTKKVLIIAAAAVVAASLYGVARVLRADAPGPDARSEELAQAPPTAPPLDDEPDQPAAAGGEDVAARTALAAAETESGPPLGDLVVRLRWKSDDAPGAGIWVDAFCDADPSSRREPRRARTGADGSVRFDGLFAGGIDLRVDRGQAYEVELAAGEVHEAALRLPDGVDLHGRVVDAEGAAVPGAGVWGDGVLSSWPSGCLMSVAEPDGSFCLRGLSPSTRLGARAAGFTPSLLLEVSEQPADPRGGRSVELRLGPEGGRVRGRVLDQSGAPVEGALVQVGQPGGYIAETEDGRAATATVPVLVATDRDGTFEYPGDLAPGQQPVHVMARGFPVWEGIVTIPAGGVSDLEVRLFAPASVVGRVLTVDDEPAAGVLVVAARVRNGGWNQEPFPYPKATTDQQGRFRLGLVPPGERELHASDWNRPLIGRAQARVRCSAGQESRCDLRLDLGATIEGRVVDADGAPLAGWGVYAQPFRYDVYPRQARTAEDGTFVVANLGDCPHKLVVGAPEQAPYPPRAELAEVQPGARGVELVVADSEAPSARVRGRLLDAGGAPPVGASLTIWEVGGDTGLFVDFDERTGAFEHGPCMPGDYVLRAAIGQRGIARSEPFELASGSTVDVGVLEVAEPGALEVELAGLPAEERERLRLSLDRDGQSTRAMEWEGDRLRAAELLPGSWILRARGSAWTVHDTVVDVRGAETTRVRLDAYRAGEVRVRAEVADAESKWTRIELEVRDADGALVRRSSASRRSVRADGGVRFHDVQLAPGAYALTATTDAGQTAVASLVVTERGAPETRLVLR